MTDRLQQIQERVNTLKETRRRSRGNATTDALLAYDNAVFDLEQSVTDDVPWLVGRVRELEDALGELLPVAAVSYEGDPWYCEHAGIGGESAIAKAQAVLAGSVGVGGTKEHA